MNRILMLCLAGALCVACNDDKPHFLPKPGGGAGVDVGALGAVASSEVTSLTDDNLVTYYEQLVNEDKKVFVTVPCQEGPVVAYTLVSTGLAETTSEEVTTPYDPVAWTVSGSNDGQSWTKVAEEKDVKFIARFQKHIYYFSKAENYTQYKFEFKSGGAQKIAISDILFHKEDPYKNWKNFESPKIYFIDQANDKGSELYHVLVQDIPAYLQWHAREICTMLYFNDAEERMPVTAIDYFLEPMPGKVSHKSGQAPKVSIHYSTDWIQKSAGISFLQLSLETRGVLFHEMVHAFQMEPKGIEPYQQGNLSWSAIEGMADAIRTQAGYHNYAHRNVNGSLMSGYQTTGMFLYWLTEAKDKDAIRNVNKSMRTEVPWSWAKALKFALGADADEAKLWTEYRNDKTNYQEKK